MLVVKTRIFKYLFYLLFYFTPTVKTVGYQKIIFQISDTFGKMKRLSYYFILKMHHYLFLAHRFNGGRNNKEEIKGGYTALSIKFTMPSNNLAAHLAYSFPEGCNLSSAINSSI